MAAEFIEIHPTHPEVRKITEVVKAINNGAVVIIPTDTVYAMSCSLYQPKAIAQICKLKNIKIDKMNLSFICTEMSQVAQYVRHMDTHIFKIMKKSLPGPYTFILPASGEVPKILGIKKKNVGIRIPSHAIPMALVEHLGHPLVTSSIKDDDEMLEYTTYPEIIHQEYMHKVDMVINGGIGGNVPSTILDCTENEIILVRKGLGEWEG
ncbi:MAG: L-threonylcarbamoyladenylate synthase [Cytophagales bacterium]|nr:L-threonylcarbamoyladenylate synthase [Cytophagales bacterium]